MFEAPFVVVVAAASAAYLIGTLPSAQVVGRRRGVDPTASGSGNPGASNVYRLLGRRAGAAVLAGDLLKGLLPTGLALALVGRPLAAACGVAAVVGHVLPATRGFRGGKGVATAGGAALVLWPGVGLVLLVVFVAATRLAGVAAVGSLSMAVGLPIGVVATARPGLEVAAAVALSALVVVRHRDNIARLRRGEENVVRHVRPLPPSLER